MTAAAPSAPAVDLVSELATYLARDPDALRRLLASHVDDGTGHCRVCRSSDTAPRSTYPCQLRALAERARDLRED